MPCTVAVEHAHLNSALVSFALKNINIILYQKDCYLSIIRASVDALYRDGANVRGDAHMLKASMLRECVNMSLLRHLVKLYKAY